MHQPVLFRLALAAGLSACAASQAVGPTPQLRAEYQVGDRQGYRYNYEVTLYGDPEADIEIVSAKGCFFVSGVCSDRSPSFVVPRNGKVLRTEQWFETTYPVDGVAFTYVGRTLDDRHRLVTVTLRVPTTDFR